MLATIPPFDTNVFVGIGRKNRATARQPAPSLQAAKFRANLANQENLFRWQLKLF
jgi:hypothetical protein